jgi:hypothetical protein
MSIIKTFKEQTKLYNKFLFRNGLVAIACVGIGLAIGLLGLAIGGSIGTVISLVGIAIAALGALIGA